MSAHASLNVSRGLATGVETGLRTDPRVLLTARLLELSGHELEGAIEAELSENPALERAHEGEIALQDHHILPHLNAGPLKPRGDDRELWRSLPADETMPDWLDLAAAHTTLEQHLRAQLHGSLPPRLRRVAMYVVGSLDDNGYLAESVPEVALACACPLEDAEAAIAALRACDPPGVGASGVVESIVLQLAGDDSVEARLAAEIVRHHLDEFAARRTARLSRRYGVTPPVVAAAFRRILDCSPFPAERFARSHRVHRSLAAQPDLVLRATPHGLAVETLGADPHAFGIEAAYADRLKSLPKRRDLADERRHLAHYVGRANDFISSLEQRRRTLARIGAYLAEHQADFVLTGDYAYLRPLTRTAVARALEMHESTVSRATQGKFVGIATGEIVGFDVFFKPALRVQKMIEGLLATEDPAAPLSDERLAALLAERGVHVARRTVNKYRDKNRLLSSRRRKTA